MTHNQSGRAAVVGSSLEWTNNITDLSGLLGPD